MFPANSDVNFNGKDSSISSWTTFDAEVGYESDRTSGVLSGSSISLNVINLFNRAPPFVLLYPSMDFTNASPIGRVVSLQIMKHF